MTPVAHEPHYESEPSYAVADALRLVLLFHDGGEWNTEKRLEWLRITGTREATTKVMCDHVRSMLALIEQEGDTARGSDPGIHERLGEDIAHGERIAGLADKLGKLP
jgi:hypothetical protein